MTRNRRAARRSGNWTQISALLLVLGAVIGSLVLWQFDPVMMQGIRLAQFDQMQRWHPRPYTPTAVRVVDIDEASLKTYGQWPWPRTRIAELVQRLHVAGAKVIAFDVLLAEPDRTSPKAMAALWQDPQASVFLKGLSDHDEVLARVLVRKGVVLGTLFSDSAAAALGKAVPDASPELPYHPVFKGPEGSEQYLVQRLHKFDAAVWPLPVLSANASGLGAINFLPDADSVVRRVPLLMRLGEKIVPSLSAEALRVYLDAANHQVRMTDAGVQDVRIGNRVVPADDKAEIWLQYSKDRDMKFISAAQVLDGTVGAEQLKGKIVLVGTSVLGLMD